MAKTWRGFIVCIVACTTKPRFRCRFPCWPRLWTASSTNFCQIVWWFSFYNSSTFLSLHRSFGPCARMQIPSYTLLLLPLPLLILLLIIIIINIRLSRVLLLRFTIIINQFCPVITGYCFKRPFADACRHRLHGNCWREINRLAWIARE